MSKHDAESLKKSIQEFGDLSGIVFNKQTKQLVGGHQRIETFKRMDGSKQVVITQRFDTPNKVGTTAVGYVTFNGEFYGYREVDWPLDRETAANIAANRISGDWDEELLAELDWWLKENNPDMLALTGQTDDEISKLLDSVGAGENEEEDDAPEVDESVPAVSKLGEIYQLGKHRLMCGDSTDVEQVSELMNGYRADMVFTDPPYNIASGSINFAADTSKAMDDLKNADWDKDFDITRTLEIIKEFSASSVTVYIWTSHFLIGQIWEQFNSWCDHVNYGVWSKPNPMPSLSKRHWTWSTELCAYGSRGSKRVVNFPESGHASNVWEVTKKSDGSHPTQKPLELCSHIIKFSSNRDQVVMDLFGGSGSTLIACEQTDRTCYMMELDPKYVDVIRKRYWKHINNGNEEGWEDATKAVETVAT